MIVIYTKNLLEYILNPLLQPISKEVITDFERVIINVIGICVFLIVIMLLDVFLFTNL